jgi:hypothetical protein
VFKLETSDWTWNERQEFLKEFGFVVTGPVKSLDYKDACNNVVKHVEENGKSWWDNISHSRGKVGGAKQVDFLGRRDMPTEIIEPFNVIRKRLEKEHTRLTGEPDMNWRPALLRSPPSTSSVKEDFADAQMFHRDYKELRSSSVVGCHSSIHAFAEPIYIVVQLGSHKQDNPTGKFIIIHVDAWCSVWFHGRLVHCGSNQVAYRLHNYPHPKPFLAELATVQHRFLKGDEMNAVSFKKAQRVLSGYNNSKSEYISK